MGTWYSIIRISHGVPPILAPESVGDIQTVSDSTTCVENTAPNRRDRIVEKPITFPADPHISDEAKDIICSLCTVDRSRRLGNISGGASRVKSHPFFRGLNWDDILQRRTSGPIIPPIRYPGDAQCFDIYPEDDGKRDTYTLEMAQQYDQYFRDF